MAIYKLIMLGFMFQEEEFLSMPMIMERLQVSVRTAHHYIKELRASYQAPIRYNSTHKLYCCIKWDFSKELRSKFYTSAT